MDLFSTSMKLPRSLLIDQASCSMVVSIGRISYQLAKGGERHAGYIILFGADVMVSAKPSLPAGSWLAHYSVLYNKLEMEPIPLV